MNSKWAKHYLKKSKPYNHAKIESKTRKLGRWGKLGKHGGGYWVCQKRIRNRSVVIMYRSKSGRLYAKLKKLRTNRRWAWPINKVCRTS